MGSPSLAAIGVLSVPRSWKASTLSSCPINIVGCWEKTCPENDGAREPEGPTPAVRGKGRTCQDPHPFSPTRWALPQPQVLPRGSHPRRARPWDTITFCSFPFGPACCGAGSLGTASSHLPTTPAQAKSSPGLGWWGGSGTCWRVQQSPELSAPVPGEPMSPARKIRLTRPQPDRLSHRVRWVPGLPRDGTV